MLFMVPQRRGKIPKGNVRGGNDLLGRSATTVALALLYAPLFPATAGRLPKRTALQPIGQIALIDPTFGIIVRILIHTVFVTARTVTIAQITRHLAQPH